MPSHKDQLQRVKRTVRKMEKDMAKLLHQHRMMYEYFNGGIQGVAQSIGTAMQIQELLIDHTGWTPDEIKAKVEAKIEQRKLETEARKAAAEQKEAERLALEAAQAPEPTEEELARYALDEEMAKHNAQVDAEKAQTSPA